MRFASLQNTNRGSSFAAAGKAVADSSAKVFDTASKFGPKYSDYSKTQMKVKAEESIAGIKGAAYVTKSGMKAVADVKNKQIDVQEFNQRKDLENKGRKAGVLAAIGKVAGAGYLAATDNTKGRERPKSTLREIMDANTATRAEIKARQQEESDAYGDFKSDPFTPSTRPDAGKGTGASGASNLKPSETGQAYMKMLTGSGMSKQQAAALVGHLKVESDNFQADTEYAPNAYGTRGRGHLQWTNTDSSNRRDNFESFASSRGLSPTSFEANSQFLLSEMQGNHGQHWTGGGSLKGFLQTGSIEDASRYLQSNFIRPSKQYAHTDRRLQGAYTAFDNFQN